MNKRMEAYKDTYFRITPESDFTHRVRPCSRQLSQIELRSGLSLSIIDLNAEATANVSYKVDNPIVGFGYVLAGDIENRKTGAQRSSKPVKSSAGVAGISYFPVSEGQIHKASGQSVKILHILLKPEILKSMFAGEFDLLPRQLKLISGGDRYPEFSLRNKMLPQLKSVAYQIVNGIPPGVPTKLYLESKALELISLQIASFRLEDRSGKSPANLTAVERSKIYAVGELLAEDQLSPPSLQKLAGDVNLSVNKLERGFKEIYGMPVFGFIRECKMQKAKLLFLESSMNVSEVAWEVGYVNVSHFSAAFKKRFGILPKQFIKRNGHP